MGNALFIVWRESAEALLVVGILFAWLRKRPDAAVGMRYLWGGVAAGIGLAIALALVMLGIASTLSGNGLEWFQIAMMAVASALIVQMVFWMRRHGRTFKRDLETDMARNAGAANWWGLLIVVALAVGRETAETVVFLYGLGVGQGGRAQGDELLPRARLGRQGGDGGAGAAGDSGGSGGGGRGGRHGENGHGGTRRKDHGAPA